MKRQPVYFHVPNRPASYHGDRNCPWLCTARIAGTLVEHQASEIGADGLLNCAHVGDLVEYSVTRVKVTRRPALKACPRCGR